VPESKTAPEGPFASNALVAGAGFGNYVPPCPGDDDHPDDTQAATRYRWGRSAIRARLSASAMPAPLERLRIRYDLAF